jgi:imidazoleglycerol phosphate synthase glutamine amidotransferase subunit HisH
MIVIVDYHMGNLGSIANALKKLGFPAMISSDISKIGEADKLILLKLKSTHTYLMRCTLNPGFILYIRIMLFVTILKM